MESILWLIYSASKCFVYWIGIERSGWINHFEAEMVQIPKSMKFIAKIEIFWSGAIHSMDWNWASYGIAQTHQDRSPFLMYWWRTVDCCNAFNCCFFYHFTAFFKRGPFLQNPQIQHVFLQRVCGAMKLKSLGSPVFQLFLILSAS